MIRGLLGLLLNKFDLDKSRHLPFFEIISPDVAIEYTWSCLGLIKEKDKDKIQEFINGFLNENYAPFGKGYYFAKEDRKNYGLSFIPENSDVEKEKIFTIKESGKVTPFRNYIKVEMINDFVFINEFSIPEYKLN